MHHGWNKKLKRSSFLGFYPQKSVRWKSKTQNVVGCSRNSKKKMTKLLAMLSDPIVSRNENPWLRGYYQIYLALTNKREDLHVHHSVISDRWHDTVHTQVLLGPGLRCPVVKILRDKTNGAAVQSLNKSM